MNPQPYQGALDSFLSTGSSWQPSRHYDLLAPPAC
jgi:hypothetical protein